MPHKTTSKHNDQHDAKSAFDAAWALLLAISALRRNAGLPSRKTGVRLSAEGELLFEKPDNPRAQLMWRNDGAMELGPNLLPQVRDFVDLYLPLLAASAERPIIVGHLGQSVDAQIATESGDSCYVNGRENLTHLHRMRALVDAIVVGAGTVAADNPRLTTRLVDGPNPVRIVIDPQRRLPADRRLFTDGEATTLVVSEEGQLDGVNEDVTFIGVPCNAEGLSLDALVATLQSRGLHALFVEGGGVTVTRWMQAGLLERLQIATAPVLIGAGRPGLRLPPAPNMKACLRPAYRVFRMGEDLLWDFDLRIEREENRAEDGHGLAPLRLF
jgi:riboflavin-specific deaminase-like protein